jgi:proteasome accessory factor C
VSRRAALRLNRILAMLPWVIAHPGATVEEVCRRFGYTRAQLVSDLNLVFVCGLPGYGPGDLMTAYIDEDEVVVDTAEYFARPLRLSPPEALTLLAAGMALVSSGQGSAALANAVAKLQRALLPGGDEALVVDLEEPALVGDLRSAAATGRVVRIDYTALATGEETTRLVEPWSVFSTSGNWYLSAFCRRAEAERVFRLDRIRDVAPTDETFTPPAEPPAPEVRYTPGEDDVRATLALGPRARWVADYYPVEVVADDGETMTIRFSASDPSVAARLAVRLGGEGRIVAGDEVRRATADLRARILARYGVPVPGHPD